MLEVKDYVALADFSVSLDNGKTTTQVKKGEALQFDGLYAVIRGEKGAARPLSKVIGEWISPVSVQVKEAPKKLARPSRNATGGRIMEHSDFPSDPDNNIRNSPSDSIDNLLKTYDKTPETKLVNGRREVTGDLEDIKKEVTVINHDASEVRRVSAQDGAPVTNKSGVEISQPSSSKPSVMSRDGQVAKATNYSGKTAEDQAPKKLVIDYEASGVIAKTTTYDKKPAPPQQASTQMVEDEIDVGEISYPATQSTDVGSSTQTTSTAPKKAATSKKSSKKKSAKKKVAAPKTAAPAPGVLKKGPTVVKGPVVNSDGQEAVVYGKVSKDNSVVIEDGIVSKVTVGAAGDIDVGEVTFSSGSDYDEPEVTFGSGGDTPADIFEGDSDVGVINADDDIDLKDILSDE